MSRVGWVALFIGAMLLYCGSIAHGTDAIVLQVWAGIMFVYGVTVLTWEYFCG